MNIILGILGGIITMLLLPVKVKKEDSIFFFQSINSKKIKSKKFWFYTFMLFAYLGIYLLILDQLSVGFSNNLGIFAALIIAIILAGLLYIAVYDFIFYSVPSIPLYIGLFIGIAINVMVLLSSDSFVVSKSFIVVPMHNAIAALSYGSIFYIIYKFSKEKAMGEADMYIAAFTGLTLGPLYTLVSFYLMVILTLVFSLPEILKRKSIKDIQLPLIPFMVGGYLISLFISPIIIQLSVLDLLIYQPF